MKLIAVLLVIFLTQSTEAGNIKNATLHLLPDAVSTHGAMCLDGSPSGYYLRKGSGEGASKWILHLKGGGWCKDTMNCYGRSMNSFGSSKNWSKTDALDGFLSDNSTVNPDFYNWNIVRIMYCDGASFAGYVEQPVLVNNKAIYYRGRANLKASLDDLLSNGMDKATDVILTGCSAGGLAVYLHADAVRDYLPKTVKKYKALPDAGYFLDTENIHGVPSFRTIIQNVFKMQNVSGGVNQDCLKHQAQTDQWKCFFAPYTYEYIKTPIFVLNSMYDTAQLRGLFGLPCLPSSSKCNRTSLEEFYDFGQIFLQQAQPVFNGSVAVNGYYIDSCQIHCQSYWDDSWSTFSIEGTSMRESFAHWYNEDTQPGVDTRLRDCEVPYNCDNSCSKVHTLEHESDGDLRSQLSLL